MKGYFRDPAGTAQAIREGWLYTGDHGVLDENGFLFIKGRFKEVMVTAAGETIYPEEIEPYYQDEHFAESCVVPLLGADGNDVPTLVVHPLKPSLSEEELQAVFNELRAKAPARCRVSKCFTVKQPLPRTPIGKIKRRALAAALNIEINQ
jgi:long-subunit acyl-CoA synthetase (AMP-forming)